jgi:hypothetical protein
MKSLSCFVFYRISKGAGLAPYEQSAAPAQPSRDGSITNKAFPGLCTSYYTAVCGAFCVNTASEKSQANSVPACEMRVVEIVLSWRKITTKMIHIQAEAES